LLPGSHAAQYDTSSLTGRRALYAALHEEDCPSIEVSEADLVDVEDYARRVGALNYEGVSGVYPGKKNLMRTHVLVQMRYENISTRDDITHTAWIVNKEALRSFYKQRGDKYTRMLRGLEEHKP